MILLFPSLIKFKSQEEKEKFNPTYVFLLYSIPSPASLPSLAGNGGMIYILLVGVVFAQVE